TDARDAMEHSLTSPAATGPVPAPAPAAQHYQRGQVRPPPPPISDAETIALFEKAVANHTRRLLAIARAIVGTRAAPEDVVQQAVMNLFQHRHRYDWRDPGGLLTRAVVNEALRLLRHPRLSVVAEEHPDNENTPVGGMIENET